MKIRAGEVTQGDFEKLRAAALDGDVAARKQCDAICQDLGFGSFQEYEEEGQRKIAAMRAIDEEPVNQLIMARLRQPEVRNDPVLGVLLGVTAKELRRAVAENLKRPIQIDGLSGQGPRKRSPPALHPALAALHPELRKRRLAVLRLKRKHLTYQEIKQKAKATSVDVVKKDVSWLRDNGLLP